MNQQWYWQTKSDYSYLTCDLLSSWQHGFFTAEFYPQTPSELTNILQAKTKAYRVKQIHVNLVLTPQEILEVVNQENFHSSLAEADAVISDRPHQSVWVASADCTPVLIGDKVTGRVAAIHAGWRGTALKIVPEAIAKFLKFGSQLADLRIALGPAISGKIYQVDEAVAIKVGRSIIADPQNKPDAAILAELEQLSPNPLLHDELPGKVRLDVPKINQIQLEQLNISSEQIAIAPYCTFQQDQLQANGNHGFFSYRRTGEKKVQWSGIVAYESKLSPS
ncbi:MAG: peptidoglycan editing factor PgeF [Cyanobacteria bacterium P01_E01_bin.35]